MFKINYVSLCVRFAIFGDCNNRMDFGDYCGAAGMAFGHAESPLKM